MSLLQWLAACVLVAVASVGIGLAAYWLGHRR